MVRVLTGPDIRLGRSRSAQFGRVQMTLCSQPPVLSASLDSGAEVGQVHFYLASDLALVGAGGPRLDPQPSEFGLPDDWRLVRERTFLRTRRYSPWNSFHQSRLTERQVLARGSVLTFAAPSANPTTPADLAAIRARLAGGLGEHRAEGLGWVMVNPEMVVNLPDLKRLTAPAAAPAPQSTAAYSGSAAGLAEWVELRQTCQVVQRAALRVGRVWAEDWLRLHWGAAHAEPLGRSGKSQWNEVHQCALRARGNAPQLLQSLE